MAIVRRNESRDIGQWNPWSGTTGSISDMRREFDRLWDRVLRGGSMDEPTVNVPSVDIIEQNNEYIVRAELPGVKRDDVKITLQNDVLSIRGEKRQEEKFDDNNYHRMEIATGTFQRSFTLPSAVMSDKIEATFEDGILSVTVPKAEESKPREIQVKTRGKAN